MIDPEILQADSGYGIWLYLIIFAVLLLISSYKFRKRFAPKFLFEFRQENSHDNNDIQQNLKIAEQNIRYLKTDNKSIYGGWMFSRDGFLIGSNDENFSELDKVNASNDLINFSPSLYRIHVSRDKNWILYKYAGIHPKDPLTFLHKTDKKSENVYLPLLLQNKVSWEKISRDEIISSGQYMMLKLTSNAKVLKGFPVINENSQLIGLVSQSENHEGHIQIAITPIENVLDSLKINVISEGK